MLSFCSTYKLRNAYATRLCVLSIAYKSIMFALCVCLYHVRYVMKNISLLLAAILHNTKCVMALVY